MTEHEVMGTTRHPEKGVPYKNYQEAVNEVRAATSEEKAESPEGGIGVDLRLDVEDQWNESKMKIDGDTIRFYNALHTALDLYHGVDGFIELLRKDGSTYIVTLDVTQRTDKLQDGHKADVVFAPPTDPTEDEDAYLEEIAELATNITRILQNKIRDAAPRPKTQVWRSADLH